MNPATNSPRPGAQDNRPAYVSAQTVAQVCGVAAYALDTRHRPDDWASPRDFVMPRAGLMYAVASLPALAASLESAGLAEAAKLLREYATKAAAHPASPFRRSPPRGSRPVKVKRVRASDAEIEAAIGQLTRAHASDAEAVPAGWLKEFEDREL